LQVGHDGHFAASAGCGLAHESSSVNVVLGFAVAEIEANHIHTGANHGFKQRGVAGSWA
jgi:hypothetical protein